jgi:hypothetical protein
MLVNIYLAEKEMEARVEDSLDQLEQKQLLQEAKGNNTSATRKLLNSIAAGLGHLVKRASNSIQSWGIKPVEERWNR